MKRLTEEALLKERQRLLLMHAYENAAQADGADFVFGIDEAGRGPLCGPVAAACCLLPDDAELLFLNDSKKLSEAKREKLYDEITEKALAYGIGLVDAARIDEINILNATYEAMQEAASAALSMLKERAGIVPKSPLFLVDGNRCIPKLPFPQQTIVKGDGASVSIAAASILAKVTRDRLLISYDEKWPLYGFAKHKGYGTKQHIEALKAYGPLPIHRKSFLKFLQNESLEKQHKKGSSHGR